MSSKFSLVIVESPAKCKKIESILGKGFVCKASCGHIMELEKGLEAIDIKNGFEPHYRVSSSKRDVVNELKRMIKKSHTVYLAMDPDREGEAIAYQLAKYLNILNTAKRSTFNEITKTAVQHAIQHPRTIDYNLSDAQKARRVLDRLVGFEISPLLWSHISSSLSLSAGRCQSPALNLLYKREEDIKAFQSKAYYTIFGELDYYEDTVKKQLSVSLPKGDDKIESNETCRKYLESTLPNVGKMYVKDIDITSHKSCPPDPFTTSTLQQEASNVLHINPKMTMSLAQNLYEAGYITYMRTDSTALSEEARKLIYLYIEEAFGKEYYQNKTSTRKSKVSSKKDNQNAQEAHECIRPVDPDKLEVEVSTPLHQKLYELIWKRAIGSQMKPKSYTLRSLMIPVENDGKNIYNLSSVEERVDFKGYTILLNHIREIHKQEVKKEVGWSSLKVGDALYLNKLQGEEQDTKPKARYTAASLVKMLEKSGIGRPSTYSTIISTLIDRQYAREGIQKTEYCERQNFVVDSSSTTVESSTIKKKKPSEKGKLFITEVGEQVRNFLNEHFDNLLEDKFTANIETQLDRIAHGDINWSRVVQSMYDSFHPVVEKLTNATNPANGKKGNLKHKIGTHGKDDYYRVRTKYGMALLKQPTAKKKGQFLSICEKLYEEGEDITLDQAIHLFTLPKTIHLKDNKKAQFCYGKHGFYLKLPSNQKHTAFKTVVVEGDWSHGKYPKTEMVQKIFG